MTNQDAYHWYECEVPGWYAEDGFPTTYWEGYHVQDEGDSDARMLQVQQEDVQWLGFVDGAIQVGTYATLAEAKADLEAMDRDVREQERVEAERAAKRAEHEAYIAARRAAQPTFDQEVLL